MPCQEVNCADHPDKPCFPTPEECAASCDGGGSSGSSGSSQKPCPEGFARNEAGDCVCDPPLNCQFPFDLPDFAKCECNCRTTAIPCNGGRVDEKKCVCFCPPGQTLDANNTCVATRWDCDGNGGCVKVPAPGGAFGNITDCFNSCNGGDVTPPCFPLPLPPRGTAILCPNGKQIGINTYPVFDPLFCTWIGPVPIIWGACDDPPPPPGSSTTSSTTPSSSSSCDICAAADDAPESGTVFEVLNCGGVEYIVLKQAEEFTLSAETGFQYCLSAILQYEYCCVACEDLTYTQQACNAAGTGCYPEPVNGGAPVRVIRLNKETCEWDQPTNDEAPDCPECQPTTSSSSGINSSSSQSSSSQSSSSQSSSSQSSSSQSSSSQSSSSQSSSSSSVSSASGCPVNGPTQIAFVISSTGGVPLNQLGPGNKFRVQFAVNDAANAAAANTTWRLFSSAVPQLDILAGAVQINENQWTRFVTAEEMLALLGLTFSTAPSGPYLFPICASTTNCTGETDTECNGRVTVIVN